MLPDFLKKIFQISTLCHSGKCNMLMNQMTNKLPNTTLEHAFITDWPLRLSPCFEADSCSGSREFSLSVIQSECSTTFSINTLPPLSCNINFNIIIYSYKTNQRYSNYRLMKDRFQNWNPTRPIHGPTVLPSFPPTKISFNSGPVFIPVTSQDLSLFRDPAHCYAQFYSVLKLPHVIVK